MNVVMVGLQNLHRFGQKQILSAAFSGRPESRVAILTFFGFYLTEAVLLLVDAYGYARSYVSWGLADGAHLIVGAILLIACVAGMAVRRIEKSGAIVAVAFSVMMSAGFLLMSRPPSLFDGIWYAMPPVLAAATGIFWSRRQHFAALWLTGGIVFLAGVSNAINYGDVQTHYVSWGYPSYWNYVTAAYEALLCLLLFHRQSRPFGLLALGALVLVIVLTLARVGDWLKILEVGYLLVPTILLLRADRPWIALSRIWREGSGVAISGSKHSRRHS